MKQIEARSQSNDSHWELEWIRECPILETEAFHVAWHYAWNGVERMHRQRVKVRLGEHMNFCLIFSCKRWCLLDPLETRLTKCTTSISWLLGRGLDESDPMPEPLYTSGLDELWAHTMLQVCCSPLCKGWTPVPFAADRCCLLGLPSLTQHHKCFIIYLNSFFISLFWVFQRILLTIKIVLIIAWYQLHNNKRIHWLSTGRKG